MKKILLLTLMMGIMLTGCKPKPQVDKEAVNVVPVDAQINDQIPEYTREELMQMEEERVQESEAPAELDPTCTPEAQRERYAEIQQLQQQMRTLKSPEDHHKVSTAYSELQEEEANCYASADQRKRPAQ